MDVILDIDKVIHNSNRLGDYFDRNSVNIDLRKYGLFIRSNDGSGVNYYETHNMGYVLDKTKISDLLKEVWVNKSQQNEITLVSPNHDSLYVPNKTENVKFKLSTLCKAENVTVEEFCDNIPNFFNVIIFNLNNISEFGGKTPEVIFENVEQLNELILLDGFVKIYKKGNTFFIYYD